MDVLVLWDDGIQNLVSSKELKSAEDTCQERKVSLKVGQRVKMWFLEEWFFGNILSIDRGRGKKSSRNPSLAKIKKKREELASVLKTLSTIHSKKSEDFQGNVSQICKIPNNENAIATDVDYISPSKLSVINRDKENKHSSQDISPSESPKSDVIWPTLLNKSLKDVISSNHKCIVGLLEGHEPIELMSETKKTNNTKILQNNKAYKEIDITSEENGQIKEENGEQTDEDNLNIIVSEPFTLKEEFIFTEKDSEGIKRKLSVEEIENQNNSKRPTLEVHETTSSVLVGQCDEQMSFNEPVGNKIFTTRVKRNEKVEGCKPLKLKNTHKMYSGQNSMIQPCSVVIETNVTNYMKSSGIYKISQGEKINELGKQSDIIIPECDLACTSNYSTNPKPLCKVNQTSKTDLSKEAATSINTEERVSRNKKKCKSIKEDPPTLVSNTISNHEPTSLIKKDIKKNFSKLLTKKQPVLQEDIKSVKKESVIDSSLDHTDNPLKRKISDNDTITNEECIKHNLNKLDTGKQNVSQADIKQTQSNFTSNQPDLDSEEETSLSVIKSQLNEKDTVFLIVPNKNDIEYEKQNISPQRDKHLTRRRSTRSVSKSDKKDNSSTFTNIKPNSVLVRNEKSSVENDNESLGHNRKSLIENSAPLSDVKTCNINTNKNDGTSMSNENPDSTARKHHLLDNSPKSEVSNSKATQMEPTLEELLDGAPAFIREVFKCESIKDGFINEDLIFVLSLLPDMEEMSDLQRFSFQLKVIEMLNDVFKNPTLQGSALKM